MLAKNIAKKSSGLYWQHPERTAKEDTNKEDNTDRKNKTQDMMSQTFNDIHEYSLFFDFFFKQRA